MTVKVPTREFQHMLVFAFRYALGRHSTAPSMVCDWIKQYVNELSEFDIDQILSETRTELTYGDYDRPLYQCDLDEWEDLIDFLEEYKEGK